MTKLCPVCGEEMVSDINPKWLLCSHVNQSIASPICLPENFETEADRLAKRIAELEAENPKPLISKEALNSFCWIGIDKSNGKDEMVRMMRITEDQYQCLQSGSTLLTVKPGEFGAGLTKDHLAYLMLNLSYSNPLAMEIRRMIAAALAAHDEKEIRK